VIAPVGGVRVFTSALRAHPEACHGRFWPVVREVLDDGVARSALRAVGEGIAVAAVERVLDFSAAVCADGEIRQDVYPGADFGTAGLD
jgi:hypothetical protein